MQSSVDGQLDLVADTEVQIDTATLDINASTLVDISTALTVGTLLTLSQGAKYTATSRTATVAGATTGTIADGTGFVVAGNGGDANNIIILPSPTVGSFLFLYTTGALEVRSSTPASVAINGGTGASAESAIPSGALCVFICVTTTAWLAFQITNAGVVSGVEVAA